MKYIKKIILHTLLHTLGFIVIALGISNILTSKLGASPIDAFNYFLHKIVINYIPSLTLGTIIIFTGLAVTLLAFIFNKNKNMIISAIFLFVVGIFVDMWMFLLGYIPDQILSLMIFRIFLAVSGMLLCSFGVAVTILTGLPPSPYERLMLVIHEKINNLAIAKIIVEGSFFILAISLGLLTQSLFEQVNLFTIVMTFSIGPLVLLFSNMLKKKYFKGELKNESKQVY
ncbi:YczE/YyaS/YitT family protein [Mariniplasma anaerobium]|uniref:Integral membrane protein n=1 Tax=Mariniplasma anaerobium TaxID=2735436 RepID=A0A7U9TLR6_9MOLU|nr:hypothetical protein [Mariniplasma anaerobium]BCR35941.1 hypothetical protein MPAN_008340 [Mariniplasma anaerobium]